MKNIVVVSMLAYLRDKPNIEEFVEPATVLAFLHACAVSTDDAMKAMQEAKDADYIEEHKSGGIRLTILGQLKIDHFRNP